MQEVSIEKRGRQAAQAKALFGFARELGRVRRENIIWLDRHPWFLKFSSIDPKLPGVKKWTPESREPNLLLSVEQLQLPHCPEPPALLREAVGEGWEKPKKDLGLVYWDYYHADTRTYEKMLDIHAQLSDNVIFAGGSWIWNGISPNYSKTYACTKAALSTCKKYNIKEVLCTAWMDNGAETPVDALLPGLVLFAHLDFHRDYDETILKQEFRNCTGGEFDDFMALDNFDSLFLNTKENKEAQNPSKYLLYQDPMLGIFDYHVKESGVNTKSYYQNIQKCMKECAKKTGKYQLLFSFYEKLAAVLADKADLGMCIKSAYDRSDRAALKDISQNVIPGIICNLTDMKSSREKIWMNDAKPFGYEILDIKIGGVITRLKSTGYRIDNYLNGNVLRLEELEEERLPYFTKGMDKRENLWNRIISGCDLNDTI